MKILMINLVKKVSIYGILQGVLQMRYFLL